MKKIALYILCGVLGALVLGLITYYLISAFAHWYEPRYIKSDADLGAAFLVSLSVEILSFVVGGVSACMGLHHYLVQHKNTPR